LADVHQSQTGERRRRKRGEEEEPIEELLDPHRGTLVGGNPSTSKHAPVISRIVDVDGMHVAIKKIVTLSQQYSSTRIDAQNSVEILEAPSLWKDRKPEDRLQHARCVLRACTHHGANGRLEPIEESPHVVLIKAGLDRPRANLVVDVLTGEGFLTRRGFSQTEGRVIWVVNATDNAVSSPTEQRESGAVTPKEEVTPTMREPAPGRTRVYRTDDEHREDLQKILTLLRSRVPSDVVVNKDGFFVFESRESIAEKLITELGCTKVGAQKALAELKLVGLSWGVPVRVGIATRYVAQSGDVTLDMVRQIRKANAEATRSYTAAARIPARGGSRLKKLFDVYIVVRQTVPDGIEPDADGFVEYETDYAFGALVAERVRGISITQADRALKDLAILGVLVTAVRGQKRTRRLKLGVTGFGEEDIKKIREFTTRSTRSTPSPVEPEVVGDSLDMDEFMDKVQKRLDEYAGEIILLKEEITEKDGRIAQLETELATRPKGVVVRAEIAQHLSRSS
jgi:hypothetical protein